jgi:hypothetical protein
MVSGAFGENYCAQTIQQNGGIFDKRKHSDRLITLEWNLLAYAWDHSTHETHMGHFSLYNSYYVTKGEMHNMAITHDEVAF